MGAPVGYARGRRGLGEGSSHGRSRTAGAWDTGAWDAGRGNSSEAAMRTLEHRVAEARAAWRRLAARRGGRHPTRLAPARLVLRLDEGDLPDSLGAGETLSPAAWQRALVSAVDWLGPVPVTLLALRSAGSPTVAELVRFAHRLECPTELQTDGTGVDLNRALELVDRGLQRLVVVVGGVSPEVHQAVVGGALDAATGAVVAAVAARTDRRAALDIEVQMPWRVPAQVELRALLGWARQAGADGLRLAPPWRTTGVPLDPELVDAIEDEADPFLRLDPDVLAALDALGAHQDGGPGLARPHAPARRRRVPCPVGGQRLELTAHGRLVACPFKPPITQDLGADPGAGPDLATAWRGAGAHLAAIRACDRACFCPELAPRPVLGPPAG